MTLVLKNQTDWTHGELSPQLISRVDLEIYSKGAQRLRNVCIIPQGGAKRRFGTDYIATISASSNQYMMIDYDYDEDTSYLLVFIENKILVYYTDILQATVVTTYPGSILEKLEIKYAQQSNSLVLVHPDYPPSQLIRGAAHNIWTFSNISFQHVNAVDFNDVDYSAATLTLNAVTVSTSRTLHSSAAIFDAGYVGGLFIGIGPNISNKEGVARITAFVGVNDLTVDIISDFDDEFAAGGMIGDNCFLGKPAWSASKGYPRTVTFFEGRMYFGGTKTLLQTILASKVNDYFNFDEGDSSDDDAFQITIATEKINTIKHLVSDKSLQIFTFSCEFAAIQLDAKPLAPGNIGIRKQTGNGSTNVRPIVVDNQTIYVRRGGKIVYSFTYNDVQEAYKSVNISVLSSHLIINPVDGDVSKHSTTDDFDFVYLINNDGSLTMYQSLLEQKVSAWTLSETVNNTAGKFKRVCSVKNNVYFIIERTINGVTKQYLEKSNWDHYLDSTIEINLTPASSSISGLTHLIGCDVRVIGDGYTYGIHTVSAAGVVELVDEAGDPILISDAIVGLNYIPTIQPMPLSIETQSGPITYTPKRITSVYVDFYESVGIEVIDPGNTEGVLIPYREFEGTFPYPVPTPSTGFYEMEILSTWEARQMLTITQQDPLPMCILGLGFKVEVGGK